MLFAYFGHTSLCHVTWTSKIWAPNQFVPLFQSHFPPEQGRKEDICPELNRTGFNSYNSILIIVNKLIVRLYTVIYDNSLSAFNIN